MDHYQTIKGELQQYADKEKAAFLPKFFKAGPDGYGAGDVFIGVTVPNQRKVAKKYYQQLPLDVVEQLLHEPVHEYRLTSLFMLVYKYEKLKTDAEKKAIVDLYLANTAYINNWDLVDSSADKILGAYLLDRKKNILYEFAESSDLWQQRMAVIATFHFIKQNRYDDTLKIAVILLPHRHDLIHKAVGWMLREIGNRDFAVEFNFLKQHYRQMPRTMLRYAIEKFPEDLRQQFLKGLV
ncbi:DNA alkylation repair enzyme [Desulfotomaculum arcticum]|uniref:DNA alkylation repair enzyme n=1 Tax=Desulfotruncus arcticus DSM 17038 TaxID=1121424 RepID=A0A1I2P5E3_9FIRM|nr:DNA alkylation repair protein [Desulfotruncus arcticus]SFG08856.1 DNA alkylation repair enzyme [Desulfotomaculum arcticum] [Desulfotruncus arcticus DSM 17038]